jgi:long-chain acyl-CoA synthetase
VQFELIFDVLLHTKRFGSRQRYRAIVTEEIRCLADIVRVHAARNGDAPAIECRSRSLTFAELYARAQAVAGALAASGVRAQDRVALIERNGIEGLEVVFGAALLDAVVVSVNWRLAPPEILQILDDAQTNLILVGPELVPAVEAIEEALGEPARIIALGGHDRWESYDTWLAHHQPLDPGTVAAPDHVAFQLYTSGTTGQPKGVMLTTSNLISHIAPIRDHLDFEPGRSVNLAMMPMFHIAGLGWAALGLYFGCRTVILRDIVPNDILEAFSQKGVTHVLMVPAVIQMLLQTPGIDTADFGALRTLVYGASPIAGAVLEKAIATMGCDFIQVYGLTETTGAITQLAAEEHDPAGRPELLRSCGKPYPWVEIQIVDPATGRQVPEGQVGELWTRSAQNMAGYWKNPAATAEALTPDGWFRTGDASYRDAAGFFYLHDRLKDMIVSGAENVYPAEVENALMRHPGVADVAVIGVPDEKWGEAVKAVVVTQPGTAPAAEELISFCRQQLAGYKCPKSVDFATALPRNPSGKLLKRELRAPYWEGVERQVG